MKVIRLLLLTILSLLFLSSCVSTDIPDIPDVPEDIDPITPPDDSGEEIVDPVNPGEKEEDPIIDPKPSIDTSNMYQLTDTLFVTKAPGIYNTTKDFNIKFVSTTNNCDLYYRIGYGSVEESNDYLYSFSKPINVSTNLIPSADAIPLFSSIDGLLNGYGESRCYSYKFINNIQTLHNYHYMPRMRVITIKYYDYDNDVTLSRTISYYMSESELTIPVIFLSIDQTDFKEFYNNIYEDIDKRCYLEYYDPLYNESFSLNSKIKLGGNWSKGYPQRTLNLNFNKDEHGNKNEPVNVHLYKEQTIESSSDTLISDITRFRLHNGGNGFEEFSWFNDAVIQTAMDNTYVSTTSYRPCITYINGEYFGLYAIREHYSDTYYSDNFGIKKSNIGVYELQGDIHYDDGNTDAEILLNSLNEFISTHHDFKNEDVYNELVTNYIDVYSLIDYLISESYVCNWDSLGNFNNMKLWISTKKDDSNPYMDMKWRFSLHDCDFAFTSNEEYLSVYSAYSYSKFPLVGKLLANETFKRLLLERAEELLSTNLSSSNLVKIITSMTDEVKDYKLDTTLLYGGSVDDYNIWLQNCNNLVNYVQHRSSDYLNNLKNILKQY